jgi:hypothetical protein
LQAIDLSARILAPAKLTKHCTSNTAHRHYCPDVDLPVAAFSFERQQTYIEISNNSALLIVEQFGDINKTATSDIAFLTAGHATSLGITLV